MARARTKLLEYLAVTESDGNTSVRLGVAIDAHVGLRCRKAVFYQRMRTEFGRHGISINSDSDGEMLVAAPAGIEGGLDDALVRIDKAIGQFRNQPMTPRMVEEVLSITEQERSRWSKDGRLRRSGTASFKRGRRSKSIRIPRRLWRRWLMIRPSLPLGALKMPRRSSQGAVNP
jgi:hypothetical protein